MNPFESKLNKKAFIVMLADKAKTMVFSKGVISRVTNKLTHIHESFYFDRSRNNLSTTTSRSVSCFFFKYKRTTLIAHLYTRNVTDITRA